MEMDLWNEDFQLAMESGLGTSAVQTNGQLGDHDPTAGHCYDKGQSFQLQGTLFDNESFSEEDPLGADWMESTDIASLLSALQNHEHLLPFESNIMELDFGCLTENDKAIDSAPSIFYNPVKPELITPDVNETLFDCFLSPPESPDDGIAVVKQETSSDSHLADIGSDSLLSDNILVSENVIFPDLDLSTFGELNENNSSDSTSSSLDSSLSSSPTSPNTSRCSIIESSPELYKVISTSSISNPISLYTKEKTTPSIKQPGISKVPRKKKSRAQPVPEYVIMEQMNKKDRKKLQNKNAAIRYRMKKKEEADDIKSEEQELEEYNKTLVTKVEDLQREIMYMKNLMKDVFKAKGLVCV